ncbi:unnamed protein product [Gongylonema pulchrum]|uniref:RNA-dependent RNA polymerase n=1 Tax=Gongylonema pulchrum TaxID=637853 RepID=A0A183E2Q5_9BILA|nr:unnamed protein product [Gongylonema pulchrum]
MDETGQLQSGQVFVQYTVNMSLKSLSQFALKAIVTGKMMFEAVDIPELHHLVDVVVFPQHGPRPHPDEMAGSDLDGDEYVVIWDPDLMLQHSENAQDFAQKGVLENKIVGPENMASEMTKFFVDFITQESIGYISNAMLVNADLYGINSEASEMTKFFVDFITQESIGYISNAMLVNADLYGINSEVCMNIAKKHSEAVDFQKTGNAPKPLTRRPTNDEHGRVIPQERAYWWPDFMEKINEPSYASSHLLGQLYSDKPPAFLVLDGTRKGELSLVGL